MLNLALGDVVTVSFLQDIITMQKAARNFMLATGETLENIWQVMTLNPARAVHVAHCKGSLEIGKDADMVLVNGELDICLTVVGGKVVYDAAKSWKLGIIVVTH